MTINELARDVHANAVAHGWWDGERNEAEIIALIHSEWSEALEEARAGRPLTWRECNGAAMLANEVHGCNFMPPNICMETENCSYKSRKPEGVAVELVDGCIRILDYMGFMNAEIKDGDEDSTIESLYTADNAQKVPDNVSELIAYLHLYTSQAMANRSFHDLGIPDQFALLGAMAAALSWVKKNGYDPLEILLEKHEFNKSRPYKHGKKF